MVSLSVLVPSVHTRYNNFALGIQHALFSQWDNLTAEEQAEVEILVWTDNKARPLGRKRNEMVYAAQGEYVAFVDDDDRIAPQYLRALLEATKNGADVIVFDVDVRLNGGPAMLCRYDWRFYGDRNMPTHYERLPNHIMCVKRRLANAARFPETNRGEDSGYAKRLKPLLTSQHRIIGTLYYYDFNSSTTETQR